MNRILVSKSAQQSNSIYIPFQMFLIQLIRIVDYFKQSQIQVTKYLIHRAIQFLENIQYFLYQILNFYDQNYEVKIQFKYIQELYLRNKLKQEDRNQSSQMNQRILRKNETRIKNSQSPQKKQASQTISSKYLQVYPKITSQQKTTVSSQKTQLRLKVKFLQGQIEKLKARCFQINEEKQQKVQQLTKCIDEKQTRLNKVTEQLWFYKNQRNRIRQIVQMPLSSTAICKITRCQQNANQDMQKMNKIPEKQSDQSVEQVNEMQQNVIMRQINIFRQRSNSSRKTNSGTEISNVKHSKSEGQKGATKEVIKIQDGFKIQQDKQIPKQTSSFEKKLYSYFKEKNQYLITLIKQYQKDQANLKRRISEARKKPSWVIIQTDGNKYQGQIVNQKKHGFGIQWYPQGSKYQGQWIEDSFHGFGKIQLTNNGSFSGYFNKNKMQKFGFYQFPDIQKGGKKKKGNSYLGEFKVGAQEGYGIYNYVQQSMTYEGDWINNRFSGFGSISYGAQNTFKGQFLMGKKHGKGYRIDENGQPHQQIWKNGVRRSTNNKTKKIKKNILKLKKK